MDEKNTTPVWGGNFSPFRLVALDGDDWGASLEEINEMRYDSTKLFRASLNVDAGIAPLSLIVLFDGTLVLPRISDLPRRKALTLFNTHLADLLLGGLLVNEVSPDDVTPGSLNLWGYHRHHAPRGHYAKRSQTLRTKRADPDDAIALLDPEVLTKSNYLSHYAAGRAVSQQLPEAFPVVFLPSCTDFSNEDWDRALLLGWTSIEVILETLWRKHIASSLHVDGIAKTRRKNFLQDTRTWSSSTRIELLWQKGNLTDAVYVMLDKARAARNAFIHSAQKCEPDDARAAIEGALSLVEILCSGNGLIFHRNVLMHLLDEATEHFRAPIADEQGRMLIPPKIWRYPDPAPGFEDWGDRPFEKRPEVQLQSLTSHS